MPRGINSLGDLATTVNGRPLNNIWNEFRQTLGFWNTHRGAVVNTLAHRVTTSAEDVVQPHGGAGFQRATQYGEPVGTRTSPDTIKLGADFHWYDSATRFTWMFLADAPSSQVEAVHSLQLEQHSKLEHTEVLRTLMMAAPRANESGVPVFGLYNGDGVVPPEFASQTFDGTHNHLFTTGGPLAGSDLDAAITTVTEHGYGVEVGQSIIVLSNPQEARTMRGFRVASGDPYDFIAGASAPAYLTDQQIVGDKPPAAYNGLPVIGSFGNALIVEDHLTPRGYVVVTASGGSNSPLNPLSFREHPNANLRGLRLVKGRQPDYPLIDSFYAAGLGTGVRHRGAAAVLQVTADAVYTPPALAPVL